MPLLQFIDDEWKQISKEEKEKLPEEEKKNIIFLDNLLKKKLDYGKKRLKNNWDMVLVVDGEVGVGKSTIAKTIGWYMSNGTLTIDHLCIGTDEFIDRMQKFDKGSTIILDESSLSIRSTSFMSQKFKTIMNIFDVCRQQNFCLILVAPEFFQLSRQIVVNRAKFLIHCYEKSGRRGFFMYFGSKKKRQLYEIGKKRYGSYDSPKSNFRGRFTDFEPFPDYKEKKKEESFKAVMVDAQQTPVSKEKEIRQRIIKRMIEFNPKITRKEMATMIGVAERTLYQDLSEIKKIKNVQTAQ
tara:strand:- start:787 stop:1674 length:888 start_codon:yes stop_codon:yes gene_type:complete